LALPEWSSKAFDYLRGLNDYAGVTGIKVIAGRQPSRQPGADGSSCCCRTSRARAVIRSATRVTATGDGGDMRAGLNAIGRKFRVLPPHRHPDVAETRGKLNSLLNADPSALPSVSRQMFLANLAKPP
jgi:hypothetical protein